MTSATQRHEMPDGNGFAQKYADTLGEVTLV